jgi:hypothetical protein
VVTDVIFVHAPVDDRTADIKDSFYEELFCQYPMYHLKILLGDCSAKVACEDTVTWQLKDRNSGARKNGQ